MSYYPRKLKVDYKKKMTIRKKLRLKIPCAVIAREFSVTRQYVWYIKQEMLEQQKWRKGGVGAV